MAMSNYLEEKLLNAVLRGDVFPSISSVYVALFLTDPGETGSTGTEVSGASYQRQLSAFTAPEQLDNEAVCKNESVIDFGVASELWGTITHVGIYDAIVSGNLLYHAELVSPKLIEAGDSLRFAEDKLVISQM